MILIDRADWVIKLRIYQDIARQRGVAWEELSGLEPLLLSYDLSYHELGNEGIFEHLRRVMPDVPGSTHNGA